MLKIFKQYFPIRNIFFFFGESIFILASILLTTWVVTGASLSSLSEIYLPKTLLICLVLQTSLYYNDLYEFKSPVRLMDLGIRLLQSLGVAAVLMGGIFLIYPQAIIDNGVLESSIVILLLFTVCWRYFYIVVVNKGIFNEKIAILGSGDLAQSIVREIQNKKDCGHSIAMIMCERGNEDVFVNFKTLLPCSIGECGLVEKVRELDVTKVVVAFSEKRGRLPVRDLLQCRLDGVEVLDGNTFVEMLTGKLIVRNLNPGWLIFSDGFQKSFFQRVLKAGADAFLAIALLVLLSPLMLIVMIAIKLDSPGGVIYSQTRLGKGRRLYQIYKFRSMVENAEKETGPIWAGEDDPRITRVGRVLRRLRIDELPQLWNVVKREMSFVGPRPERPIFVGELSKTIPYYDIRLTIKPGITGWAQINYSYGASLEDAIEKLNYDLFYIKNMSLFMDLMIIFRTIKIVMFGRGSR
jgi:sugar transferase (PEP-CTERM system associated)